jgi:hypothetical protein
MQFRLEGPLLVPAGGGLSMLWHKYYAEEACPRHTNSEEEAESSIVVMSDVEIDRTVLRLQCHMLESFFCYERQRPRPEKSALPSAVARGMMSAMLN